MDDIAPPNLNEQAGPSEDAATLAAIDEGIRDAEAGRVFTAEEVRRRLAEWVTKRHDKEV